MKRMTVLLIALAVSAAACTTPTEPTPPPLPSNVAGTWSGTWEDRASVAVFVMELNQSGPTVTGTWALTNLGWNGTVTGSADSTSFTGTFTVNAPRSGGGGCTGTASFSGPADSGARTLKWSSAGVTGNCTFGTGPITINLQRR